MGFGLMPDGTLLPPTDFAVETGETVWFNIDLPSDARGFGFTVKVEMPEGQSDDNVLRLLISETQEGDVGRPSWALLGNRDSEAFKSWKNDVLAYAASFPQTSHGEPTPSDRDPIPEPFNNTYNQPERDWFHQRLKYFRQDDFLVENMLDDQTRRELDQAWADLLTTFAYHDIYLGFVGRKFEINALEGKSVEDLGGAFLGRLPEEPRAFAVTLRDELAEMRNARGSAEAGHLDDAVRFTSRAWRRALTPAEERGLRAFYTRTRESFDLNHEQGVKALLARVLVAPDFLYRLERAPAKGDVAPLSDWEMANRLSYLPVVVTAGRRVAPRRDGR